MPYGKVQPEPLHLVQLETHTGVISTGLLTEIFNEAIDAPEVAHLKVIGVDTKALLALQSV